jgi:chromosome partitioning protein
VLPTDIHLTGAEFELADLQGRETLLREALQAWRLEHRTRTGSEPADYVLFDCPPSLGLLSLNALAASDEVFLAVQTEFLALQGMTKLVGVLELVKQRLHPAIAITGIVACLHDSRLRLAREVLAELRAHFPAQVFRQAIGTNVKLAESPSFGQTIFEYAPESSGARDYRSLALEVLAQEASALPTKTVDPLPPPADAPRMPTATAAAPVAAAADGASKARP